MRFYISSIAWKTKWLTPAQRKLWPKLYQKLAMRELRAYRKLAKEKADRDQLEK